jgi:anti-sigma regulatory factor (Ser/Thr protein kinase)
MKMMKMSRTTLGRFDILGDADLHAAVLKLQSNNRLRLAFGAADVTMVATVLSELGRNILKYGGGRGHLLVSWIEDEADSAVEIQAVDRGPGFEDVSAALQDHFSTGGTLGLGLPGTARIMDTLEIDSQPGRGAVVTARKWTKPHGKPGRNDAFGRVEVGTYVRPCIGETLSGDAALMQPGSDGVFVAVIDALGHGPHAHQVASRLNKALSEWLQRTDTPRPASALSVLHEAARGTRGAVAAVAWLDVQTLEGSVAGVGNVRCRLVGSVARSIVFAEGVLGSRMRPPVSTPLALRAGDVLLLFSDGVKSRWDALEYPSLGLDPSATAAFNIVRRFGKGTDDACCAVTRCRW